jgi:hypothetical protein
MSIDLSKIIYDGAIKHFDAERNKDDYDGEDITYYHCIPIIRKIENFKVKACIKIEMEDDKYKIYYFIITYDIDTRMDSKYLLFNMKKKIKNLSLENIKLFIKKITRIMKKIKFDKLLGELVSEEKTNRYLPGQLIFGNTYLDNDDCCICYDSTITKLICEHYVCLECMRKIKIKKCPQCRDELKIIGECLPSGDDSSITYSDYEESEEPEDSEENKNNKNNKNKEN